MEVAISVYLVFSSIVIKVQSKLKRILFAADQFSLEYKQPNHGGHTVPQKVCTQ